MKPDNAVMVLPRITLPGIVQAVILAFTFYVMNSGSGFADDLTDILSGFEKTSDKEDISNILDGFEDTVPEQETDEPFFLSDSPLDLSGSIGVSGAFNLAFHTRPPGEKDRKGLAKFRGEIDLTADLDLASSWRFRASGHAFYDTAYAIHGWSNYNQGTLDAYEHEEEYGEVWLQGSLLPDLDIKTGRQIVVWGKSDNIRITDVLNPMDRREPGMTDIEDLRLPVTMTKVDYSVSSSLTLSVIAVHEVRFDKWPVYGSDFYTSDTELPGEEVPGWSLDNQEAGLSLSGVFSGWDAALYAARIFDDTAHIEINQKGEYRLVYARVTMFGAAAGIARGNWLYKGEAAYFTGLKFAAMPCSDKSRLDILAGIEYSGFTDTSISIEAANSHLFDFEDTMSVSPDSAEENDFQWAIRISRDFFHERLNALFLLQAYDLSGEGGMLERIEFTYDLSDNWEASAGLVLYQSGDRPAFQDINECNRLFFQLHYSF